MKLFKTNLRFFAEDVDPSATQSNSDSATVADEKKEDDEHI